MTFLKILGVIATGALLAIGVHFADVQPTPSPSFGSSFSPVQGQTYTLSGAGINSTATTITLNAFKTPDGRALTMAMFGSIGYAVIDPNSPTKIEDVTFTGITQNANGSAVLTGVSRGMDFVTPYTASTTLGLSHAGGSYLILSNSAGFYGQQFLFANSVGTSTGGIVFSSTTPPHYDFTPGSFIGTSLVDYTTLLNTAIQGAGTSTESNMGIVQLSTAAQVGASTASSTKGAPLVIPNKYATTTPGTLCTGGTWNCLVATSLGKISQSWLDLTASFTWAGAQVFSSTATFNGTVTFNGSVVGVLGSYFGDGRDGPLTIASNSTTTITRDMYYTSLTINGALVTNGCRVFVSGTVSGSGSVNFGLAASGTNGTAGSGNTTGAVGGAGGATTTTSVNCRWLNAAGTAGGPGAGGLNANGSGGVSAVYNLPSLSGIGATGGAGSAGTGQSGGNGGSVGNVSTTTIFGIFASNVFDGLDAATSSVSTYPSGARNFYGATSQATGGGGGGTNNSSCSATCSGGGGGGGGASGGIVWLFANTWTGTFTILSQGGNGGNGGAAAGGQAGAGGGGAGGNGGVSVVVYNTKTWTGTYSLTGGTGGTSNATAGINGTTGKSYEIPFGNLTR